MTNRHPRAHGKDATTDDRPTHAVWNGACHTMTAPLPRPLAVALGRWHDKSATRNLVAALEASGVPVAVNRLQLGDPRAAGFGEVRVIYQTPGAESEDNHAG